MRARRPGGRWSRGVVLCALLSLAGCGAGPYDAAPPPASDDAAACAGLMSALPDTLADQERLEVTGGDERVAAWGDPAIVLTCDVPEPSGFSRASTCVVANGTGWFVPDDVLVDETLDVTMTAVEFRPRVEVVVPGDYRPDGFQAAAGALGRLVAGELTRETRCR